MRWGAAWFLVAVACSSTSGAQNEDGGDASASGTTGTNTTNGVTGPVTSAETGVEDTGAKFDVGGGTGDPTTDTVGQPTCKVVDDMDAIPECDETAPPDAFEPDVQWSVLSPYTYTTPLVANLTDDNDDGEIDLCDVPDVLVTATNGNSVVLDGATGTVHYELPFSAFGATPAIGDIDDDGLPEIVALDGVYDSTLLAFEHDGTPKWTGPMIMAAADTYAGAIALADLDNDGDVEIIQREAVYDANGQQLWVAPQPAGRWSATTAADLDDDGDLEVVLGHAAYHHDGQPYYLNPEITPGYPQVGDLDGDARPEVLVMYLQGIAVLEHDGTTKFRDLRPTGDPIMPMGAYAGGWERPATIHDFDGDGQAEFAVSSAFHYSVYESDATLVWSADVLDNSGIAAGTAFDFLGDGVAEAMYADESTMFIFDGAGLPLLTTPRNSGTMLEYPVVADIDNDGSSEIVVGSASGPSPAVQVIRDVEDRWIQARRIWNQHTYHVTNVREDGTIPQFEQPHWEHLNTFRTNAQIEGGGVCKPDPEG